MSPEPKSLKSTGSARIGSRRAFFWFSASLPFNNSVPEIAGIGTQVVALSAHYQGTSCSPVRGGAGQRARSMHGAGVRMVASPASPLSRG